MFLPFTIFPIENSALAFTEKILITLKLEYKIIWRESKMERT